MGAKESAEPAPLKSRANSLIVQRSSLKDCTGLREATPIIIFRKKDAKRPNKYDRRATLVER